MWADNGPETPFLPSTPVVPETVDMTAGEFSVLFLLGKHRRSPPRDGEAEPRESVGRPQTADPGA
jgi:hypothetical protein